uniref:SEC16 homolog B, endoplasmic reticulum export factor n=1 Tax=Microcebus murinus TaxID=30608 RepID=A0A8C5XUY8_MICMU
MEFWVPQRLPQPRGRPIAPSNDPDWGLQRDGHHRPAPHPQHNRERFHQWQDVRGGPQPQQDPRADHRQPHYASRPGQWHQPLSGVDCYEGGYLSQLYARPGYMDQYQSPHSAALREECTHGKRYYPGFPQWLQEARVPRQGSPYVWYEDYQDQKYFSEHHHENQRSVFGTHNETQSHSSSQNPYNHSPASSPGQERARELLPESLLTGAQENKPPLTCESSLLRQHESGLSSSSCELSQYMADAEQCVSVASAAWSPVQAGDVSAADPKAPMKFYGPHVPVSFGPGGQLVCVAPSSPTGGRTALVDLHSVEIILNDSEEQEEMRIFSGPLIREDVHKVDIMMFCQQKAAQSRRSETPGSRDSALLWQLLVLLCRQNGEALEWAMRSQLWGHALFLASKMDTRTYSWVMSGFTSTLALNDPLQTLFQLMSGRIPQAATCCGDKQWGDWRPHLAVMLSNQAGDAELHQRAVVAMGDTLAGKGLAEAAHVCYLVARLPFGYYTAETARMALLGSSHSQEFWKFATTEAMQRTEIFEYCQMLGRPKSFIAPFQVYKLLYASRLADYGLVSQALHYCEAIGAAVLSQGESSHPVLLVELIKLAERLQPSDPLAVAGHGGDRGLEPDWLAQLRRLQEGLQQKLTGDLVDPHSARSDISGSRGATTENTFYQDLSGPQGYSEAPGHRSALWPTSEQTCLPQPSPQQPFPLQPGSYPAGGGAGQTGAPMLLYSVPETHLPGTSGSVAVTQVPGGTVWEETLQTHPLPGEYTAFQETFQHPDGLKVISKPQAPLVPRARSISESSTMSATEDEEESSDEADKKPPPNAAGTEKPGDGQGSTKSSGFGWFSWFRSRPTDRASPSRDGGPTDSADSEGVSSELFSRPGVLLPPPSSKEAVPLYNPSQVPQMPMATSQNRPNRLAQRRYPTQPC